VCRPQRLGPTLDLQALVDTGKDVSPELATAPVL